MLADAAKRPPIPCAVRGSAACPKSPVIMFDTLSGLKRTLFVGNRLNVRSLADQLFLVAQPYFYTQSN